MSHMLRALLLWAMSAPLMHAQLITMHSLAENEQCFDWVFDKATTDYVRGFADTVLHEGTCSQNGFSQDLGSHEVLRIPLVGDPVIRTIWGVSTWDTVKLKAEAFLARPMLFFGGSPHPVSQRSNAAPKVPALASTASNELQQVHSDWYGPMGDWADLCVAIDDQGDMKDVCEEIEYQKHRTHARAAKEAWAGPTGDWLELCSVADDYEKKDFEDMCQYLDMEADPSQSTGRKLAMSSDSQVGVVVAGKKGFALPSQGMQTVIRNSGTLSQNDRKCGTCTDKTTGSSINLCMTKVPSSGPIHMGRLAAPVSV
jgi:hypothetical protein